MEYNMKTQRSRASPASISDSLSTKDSRNRVYACDFCDFIQANLFLEDDEELGNERTEVDPALEAKYLFHLRTQHGLER
jgi:hypothetical protein